ncbi:YciI family protein [Kribbella sp. CA-247076]|uniref:YciI family protein n=1 Tax=Kribbella sp. CA-247076 TaxID=3239941 RepID=UPI003D9157AA
MTYYLLRPGRAVQGPPRSDEELRQHMEAIRELEAELKSAGAWVFGGRLHDPSTATVVRADDHDVLTTDGPFAETKDHLGGFYLIRTGDLDDALAWAGKVSALIGASIEVRPFVDELTS